MPRYETLIREMDHDELVEALARFNPFAVEFYAAAPDKTLRRTLVRYHAGAMTNEQADEVLAEERP